MRFSSARPETNKAAGVQPLACYSDVVGFVRRLPLLPLTPCSGRSVGKGGAPKSRADWPVQTKKGPCKTQKTVPDECVERARGP